MAGGAASSSSATTYIESGAGIGAGGRTGWTSVVTGTLFFPFLFIAPLIGMVPPQATAPALIIVGWLLISSLTEAEGEAEHEKAGAKFAGIDFHDLAIGLSAALIIMIMPFTWSITNGIGFGFIAYVLVRVAQGDWRRVHPFMYASAAAFALYFMVPLLQDHLSWI
jgi:AGZA family xanthine/uracil permease-like MFS transporter